MSEQRTVERPLLHHALGDEILKSNKMSIMTQGVSQIADTPKISQVEDEVFKAVCRMCHGGCGTLVHRKKGRITQVVGDPDHPINHGLLCSKAGVPSIEQLYHPDRLNYPLIRIGERGSGKWRQGSWDEALELVASQMLDIKNRYGAEALIFGRGMGLNNTNIISRLANVFGTPNVMAL